MKWYRNLYLGEEAKKAKYKILGKISKRHFTMDTYLITISSNPDNILDIVQANIYLQPHFKGPEADDIYVVGIAKGKDESLELVRLIVDETYQATGGCDVSSYLKFGQKIRKNN